MSSLAVLFVLSVLLAPACQGMSIAKTNDITNDLSKPMNEDPKCENLTDTQPKMCQEMVAQDPEYYCEDYPHICQRTCQGCPPPVEKAQKQQVYCEDERDDCPSLMSLRGQDNCQRYPSYAYDYCRKTCGLCLQRSITGPRIS